MTIKVFLVLLNIDADRTFSHSPSYCRLIHSRTCLPYLMNSSKLFIKQNCQISYFSPLIILRHVITIFIRCPASAYFCSLHADVNCLRSNYKPHKLLNLFMFYRFYYNQYLDLTYIILKNYLFKLFYLSRNSFIMVTSFCILWNNFFSRARFSKRGYFHEHMNSTDSSSTILIRTFMYLDFIPRNIPVRSSSAII